MAKQSKDGAGEGMGGRSSSIGREEFSNQCNDSDRHAHTLSGDAAPTCFYGKRGSRGAGGQGADVADVAAWCPGKRRAKWPAASRSSSTE